MKEINWESVTTLEAALFYADLGLPVFPQAANGKVPVTAHGLNDATTNKDQITSWFSDHPDWNLAIKTGKPLLVIDIDRHGEIDGMKTLNEWKTQHGPLPETSVVISPHDGMHLYYLDTAEHRTVTGILPGIDVKAEGGCITVPPSKIDGKAYRWMEDRDISNGFSMVNESLLTLLGETRKRENHSELQSAPETIPSGSRVASLMKLMGRLRTYGLDPETIKTTIRSENAAKCQPPLTEQELEREVFPALKRNWEVERPYTVQAPEAPQETQETLPAPVGMGARKRRGFKQKRPEIISGVLRQGDRMLLSGQAKTGKSFAVMNLMAASLAEGKWFGHDVKNGRWLYVNLEVDEAECEDRMQKILTAYGDPEEKWDQIEICSLENETLNMQGFRDYVSQFSDRKYTGIIIDTFYMLSDAEENSNSEITKMLRIFNEIAKATGAAIIFCHHFAKGSSAYKSGIDKASGAGAFARYPSAIVTMDLLDQDPEERAEHKAIRAEFTLRSGDEPAPVNLFFDYPTFTVDEEGVLENRQIISEETMRKRANAAAKAEEEAAAFEEQSEIIDEVLEEIDSVGGGFTMQSFIQSYSQYDPEITPTRAAKILRAHKFYSQKTGKVEYWYQRIS